jgi:hypothetical protein
MLSSDQARKHLHAAGRYGEVVIAIAERLSAALDDAQPSALTAIDRRELIEMDDAVGDAVDGAIGAFGGKIVEHHHVDWCRAK